MELKKIVITGANGFLASSIIKELLLLKEYFVVGLVRDKSNSERVDFLKEFEGANKSLLIEEAGELGSDYSLECYNRVFKGAFAIIHTASPFILYSKDSENDLFKPSIKGNLNVLKAALNNQDSVKKVIISSSTATIVNEINLKEKFTNQDWWDGKGLPIQYIESKYLSEMESLNFIKSIENSSDNNKSVKFEFIRINPGLIMGPTVDKFPSSCGSLFLKNIYEIVNDDTQDPNYYSRTIVMCDIRDTVKYFIGALESSQSLHMERILIGNLTRSHSFKDVSDSIKSQFPDLNITQTIFNKSTIPKMPYYTLEYLNPKINLNEPLISFEDSIKETMNYFIKNNKKLINKQNK